jgi:hypothetical protein
MKNGMSLVVLASLAITLAGCSKQSATGVPAATNLGVVEVTNNEPFHCVLADGRACTIIPVLLTNGQVQLATSLMVSNALEIKRSTSISQCPVGKAVTLTCDRDTAITLTLHTNKQR